MAIFYFDVVGDLAASDLLGLECDNVQGAKQHGRLLAQRTAAEHPELVREGNYIAVRNARGFELCRFPISLRAGRT